jgi:four helix bundle protein
MFIRRDLERQCIYTKLQNPSLRMRKYEAVFKNKLTDSMQEASETQSWLEFSSACKYIEKRVFEELDAEYEGIISMINAMEKNAQKFCF